MAMKVTLIHHVLLTVRDLEQARYFYGQVLGLPELQRPNGFCRKFSFTRFFAAVTD